MRTIKLLLATSNMVDYKIKSAIFDITWRFLAVKLLYILSSVLIVLTYNYNMANTYKYTTYIIICLITSMYGCKTVDIGAVHFSTIYEGAPNEDVLRRSVVIGSSETMRALQVFEEHTKREKYMVNNEEICFNFVVKESDYSDDSTMDAICGLLEDGIRLLVSPFGTAPGNFAADIIEQNLCGIPNLGTVIQLSGSTQDKTFGKGRVATFGTMPTLHQMVSELIPYFRTHAYNVTLVKTEGSRPNDPSAVTCDDLEDKFLYSDITKINSVWYDGQFASTDPEHYSEVAKEIKEIDNDLMVFCGLSRDIMLAIASEFETMAYTPRGVITTANDIHVNETVFDYWMVPSSIIGSDFEFDDADFIKSEAQYVDIYKSLFPEHFHGENYKMGFFTMFAGEIYLKSMQVAETTDNIDSILKALKKTRFKTMLGELYYSASNENQNAGIALQKFPDYMGIVGPYQVTNTTLIYPIPKWEERIHRTKYHGTEIAGIVLLSLGIINTFTWSAVLLLKQEQTLEALVISFGGLCMYTGTMLWTPKHISVGSCVSTPIMVVMGLVFIIGMIVFKMISIRFKIKNFYKYLLYTTAILLAIYILLFIFWNVFAKPEVGRAEIDVHRIYRNHKFCKTKKLNGMFVGLTSIPLISIYLFGIYLSFVLFNVVFREYTQNKIYAFSLYNIGICVIIIMVLEVVGVSDNVYILYSLRTIIIFLSTTLVVSLVCLNVIMSNKSINKKSTSSATTSSGASRSNSTISPMDNESRNKFYRKKEREYKIETKEMRQSIKQMRKELEALKKAKNVK